MIGFTAAGFVANGFFDSGFTTTGATAARFVFTAGLKVFAGRAGLELEADLARTFAAGRFDFFATAVRFTTGRLAGFAGGRGARRGGADFFGDGRDFERTDRAPAAARTGGRFFAADLATDDALLSANNAKQTRTGTENLQNG